MSRPQFQLGGQALIEGVMMRGPSHVGAALRHKDGSIEVRVEPFHSVLRKKPYLNIPFFRGIIALCEMMALGMRYLNWSSSVALADIDPAHTEEAIEPKAMPIWLFLLTVAGSLGLGMVLFVAVPNIVADLALRPVIGNNHHADVILLNLAEGLVKLAIFICYIWIIGRRSAIKRIFEYHGSEHKVVYAAENNRPITPDGARPYDTPHPRCGTGFALLTVFVSIICFSFLPWTVNPFWRVGMRFLLLPVVAGVSYEIIKATVNPRLQTLAKLVVTPGMWLQRLTTAQPDDEQLEVACAAMNAVLLAERAQGATLSPEVQAPAEAVNAQ